MYTPTLVYTYKYWGIDVNFKTYDCLFYSSKIIIYKKKWNKSFEWLYNHFSNNRKQVIGDHQEWVTWFTVWSKLSFYLLSLPNCLLYLGHPHRSSLGTDLLNFHTKGYKPHCYLKSSCSGCNKTPETVTSNTFRDQFPFKP